MKSNHTVGEWKAELTETFCVIRDKDNHVIARTNPDAVYGTGESIANAKLIAAAPILFNAIKNLHAAAWANGCSAKLSTELKAAMDAMMAVGN